MFDDFCNSFANLIKGPALKFTPSILDMLFAEAFNCFSMALDVSSHFLNVCSSCLFVIVFSTALPAGANKSPNCISRPLFNFTN